VAKRACTRGGDWGVNFHQKQKPMKKKKRTEKRGGGNTVKRPSKFELQQGKGGKGPRRTKNTPYRENREAAIKKKIKKKSGCTVPKETKM